MRAGPKDARPLRSTSKLNPPSSALDKCLYALVVLLWCCVGATWATARARVLESRMTTKLQESNGRRAAMREIDWWKTGRAKLTSSLIESAARGRRLGQPDATAHGEGEGASSDAAALGGSQGAGSQGGGTDDGGSAGESSAGAAVEGTHSSGRIRAEIEGSMLAVGVSEGGHDNHLRGR